MAKFTKLNIGDSVASSGGGVWKKLSAESGEEDSIVGSWTFNAKLVFSSPFESSVNFTSYDKLGMPFDCTTIRCVDNEVYYDNKKVYASTYDNWMSDTYTYIVINAEPTDEVFITWLKANATKQGASETKHQLAIEHNGTIYHWDVDSTSALWLSLNGKYDTTNTYYIYCPYASSIAELYTDSAGSEAFVKSDADVSQYGDYGYSVSETYYTYDNDLGGSN